MKKRIMVVEDNINMVNMLKEYFSNSKEIEVTKEAHDGEEAFNIIKDSYNEIDCVLLDLVMPNKDGLYLLEKLSKEKIKLNIIVTTSYNEQETIRNVSEYGVKYFVLKPFDLLELEKRILLATKQRNTSEIINTEENNLHIKITRILHDLGIPSNIKGYQYIRDAIFLVYSNPTLIGGITKELYPLISKKYSSSITRVERAMRHAIEVSWNRGDWDLMQEIFGHSVDIDKAKPTNSEFIVTIADKLKLDMIKNY